jgi:cobalt/nickel transport system permease protein
MVLRLILTVAAAVATLALTGIAPFCQALERLGLPRVFVLQVASLHRYAFVLMEEAFRMLRARELRAHGQSLSMTEFASLAGSLLLRAWDRARRVHQAMLARGFDGTFHSLRPLRFRLWDALFVVGWVSFFLLLRWVNVPRVLGLWVNH